MLTANLDKPGLPNLSAMRGRRKGGAATPQARTFQGIAAHADAFLTHLAARAYSQASIDAHRWALRQFSAWAADRGTHDPAAFARADLEAYQLFLHHSSLPCRTLRMASRRELLISAAI